MYLSDQLEARGLLSYKTISLRAKMVFNLLFVFSGDFQLLIWLLLGSNSWAAIKERKKRKEEKGKGRK